jgi:hypothetical protein
MATDSLRPNVLWGIGGILLPWLALASVLIFLS